jgi:hypothetical protein
MKPAIQCYCVLLLLVCPLASIAQNITWYQDFDGDGWGNPNISVVVFGKPLGYVQNNLDCNDHSFNNIKWDTVGAPGGASLDNYDGKIAIDKNGTVYVASSTSNGFGSLLTINKLVGNTWTLVGNQILVSPFLTGLHIAIDGNNMPYVVYGDESNGGRITVRKFDGTSWTIVGVAGFSTNPAFHLNIALDANNIPYVIYNEINGFGNSETFVSKFNGSSWEDVGSASIGTSMQNNVITFDKFNRPAIGGGAFRAVVKVFNGSVWNTIGNANFSSGGIRETSLAFDRLNNPYFGYRELTSSKANVRKLSISSGLWEPLGTADFTADTAMTPYMAIDSANTVYVGFEDFANGHKATVMKFNGTAWETVGNAGFSTGSAFNTQLVLSPVGIPYMLFADQQHSFNGTVMKIVPQANAPTITSISALHNPSCINSVETLTVNGSLNDANIWKWYKGSCGGTLVTGGSPAFISQNATTTYFVRAEGNCLSAPSNCSSIILSTLAPVSSAISITANPGNAVTSNTPITFTVHPVNGGTLPTYEWQLNNVNAGTSSDTYLLAVPQNGDVVSCSINSSQYCVGSTSASFSTVVVSVTNPIVAAEYFIDVDPGIGNGTSITITPSDTINFTANIPTTSLSLGFHTLFIRSKLSDGTWSMFESRGFNIATASANVVAVTNAEYFIDTDPGLGNGIALNVGATGDAVSFSSNISTASLGNGFHNLFIRAKDADGHWGMFESKGFYITTVTTDVTNITAAEYFIDADPGLASGIPMSIGSSGGTVAFSSNISTASLGNGFHNLFIRAKDADGHWGMFESKGFYITTVTTDVTNITAAEYFIDTDPGIANGIPVSIGSSGGTVNFSASISTTSLGVGFHNLFIRTKDANGQWGLFESRSFYIASGSSNVSNITAAEYFIDTDPGVGNATSLTINSPGSSINQPFTCAVPTNLVNGQHFLFIRVKDLDGRWGLFERDTFMVNNAIIQWTGNSNTDWNNTGNWSSATVPNAASANVLVPLATNQPSINASSFTVGDLSMDAATSLSIANGSSLNVAGNAILNGTVTGNGELVLNGPAVQTLQGTGSIANLNMNNNNGVTIASGLSNKISITNTLLPTTGTLTTNGNLVLTSSPLGTARVSAGNIAGGYISGNVTMQRFIPGGFRKYRFIGHPFSATLNLTELTDDIDVTGSITGSNANNFTPSTTSNPSAFGFVESNDDGVTGPNNNAGWLPFTSGNSVSTLAQGKGMRVLVRGSKGQAGSLTGGAYTPNAVTISMTGNLQQGNFVQPLDFSSISKGWNLISNPYASNIDWTNVTRINVDNAVYTYRPSLSGGNYGSFVNGSSANGGSQVIESSNSFFVRANAVLPTLGWHETDKVSNNPSNSAFRTNTPIHNRLSLMLTNNSSSFTDEVVIRFGDDNATDHFDSEYDAANLAGSNHDLFVLDKEQFKYSIYHASQLKDKQHEHREIFLGMDNLVTGEYIITASILNGFVNGHTAYLKDALLDTLVPITSSEVYRFNVVAPQSSISNRFSIVFNTKKEMVLPSLQAGFTVQVLPNPVTDFVQIVYDGLNKDEQTFLSIIDMKGKIIQKVDLGKIASGKTTINTKPWAKGAYTIRLINGDNLKTKMIIKQ